MDETEFFPENSVSESRFALPFDIRSGIGIPSYMFNRESEFPPTMFSRESEFPPTCSVGNLLHVQSGIGIPSYNVQSGIGIPSYNVTRILPLLREWLKLNRTCSTTRAATIVWEGHLAPIAPYHTSGSGNPSHTVNLTVEIGRSLLQCQSRVEKSRQMCYHNVYKPLHILTPYSLTTSR